MDKETLFYLVPGADREKKLRQILMHQRTAHVANSTDSQVESKGPLMRKRPAKYETRNGYPGDITKYDVDRVPVGNLVTWPNFKNKRTPYLNEINPSPDSY